MLGLFLTCSQVRFAWMCSGLQAGCDRATGEIRTLRPDRMSPVRNDDVANGPLFVIEIKIVHCSDICIEWPRSCTDLDLLSFVAALLYSSCSPKL